MNDIFRLTGFNVSEVELHVFNRWGNEVYYPILPPTSRRVGTVNTKENNRK
jgi:hypothetical protein